MADDLPEIENDETAILPTFGGLVFHGNPSTVELSATAGEGGVTVPEDSDLMRTEEFMEMARAYLAEASQHEKPLRPKA